MEGAQLSKIKTQMWQSYNWHCKKTAVLEMVNSVTLSEMEDTHSAPVRFAMRPTYCIETSDVHGCICESHRF